MKILHDKNIELRSLVVNDLDWLLQVENNPDYWKVSGTIIPYSRDLLKEYISNAQQDIKFALQYRFVIIHQNKRVGLIDLFDYDAINKRVGIGILILKEFQNKRLASKSLQILINYCFNTLKLHQIYANIASDNLHSIKLFKNQKFTQIKTSQNLDNKENGDDSIQYFQRNKL